MSDLSVRSDEFPPPLPGHLPPVYDDLVGQHLARIEARGRRGQPVVLAALALLAVGSMVAAASPVLPELAEAAQALAIWK